MVQIMSIFTRFATFILAVGFLSSCSQELKPSTAVVFCALGGIPNEQCQYNIEEEKVTFYSSHPAMPEETMIDLYVTAPRGWQIQKSYLNGESMYMGTIPIVWNLLENGRWQAKLRLAACTDPKMIWRLNVEFITETGLKPLAINFPVTSVQKR